MKRELASVVIFESHAKAGTVCESSSAHFVFPGLLFDLSLGIVYIFGFSVFNQGEEGTSWYIIQKGSVNVVIYGKVGVSAGTPPHQSGNVISNEEVRVLSTL